MSDETVAPVPPPPRNDVVTGALWMTAGAVFFACMIGIIRHVSEALHPFEIAFFRNLFGLAFMLPWLIGTGFTGLRTERLGLFALRALIGMGAMLSWFWAIAHMPLPEAVALNFTSPMFTTVLAVLVLGEVVRMRRWAATLIGFVGAVVILRPGLEAIQPAALAVLSASVFMGASKVLVKMLARTESSNTIVSYMVVFLTPMSLIPALFVWQTPDLDSLLWLFLLGGLATVAHQCMARALRAADASAIIPFDYARLPFTAVVAYLAFGQVADIWTWIGAAVIAGAGIYIAHREHMTAQQALARAQT